MRLTLKESISLFLASVLFLIFFSTSTSFIGPVESFDSSIFQLIGKYWVEGVFPYVGLWDSKGPVIFFINAIGYYLTDSYLGVFFIQVICLFLTLSCIYLFFKKEGTIRLAWIQTLLSLVVLSNSFEGGNSVEEYILPLLTPALLYMYHWSEANLCLVTLNKPKLIIDNNKVHSVKYAFLYGLVLSFSLLTRLTNALGVCVGIILIVIYLVYQRQWKNLLQCSGSFIAGFLILTLPFLLYFHFKGILSEMWYGTVGYNVGYTMSAINSYHSVKGFISFLLSYFSCYFLIGVSILMIIFQHDRKIIGWFWLIVSFITFLFFFFSYRYAHYNIISLPYLCIGMQALRRLIKGTNLLSFRKFLKTSSLAVVLLVLFGCGYQSYQAFKLYSKEYSVIDFYQSFISKIPEEELNSFVGYNTSSTYYLALNICPYYPFFYMQDKMIERNKTIISKIHDTFENGNVKWILVDLYNGQCGIQDILDARYERVNTKGLALYKLK